MRIARVSPLAVFALVLASSGAPRAQGVALSVRVLDAKKTSCTGGTPQYVAGANVTLLRSGERPRTAISDRDGRALFVDIPRGAYLVSASKAGCTTKSAPYSVLAQNGETAIGVDNCATSAAYDVSASLSGPGQAAAGGNYLLTLTVKNNGAGAPSKVSKASITRYVWTGEQPALDTAKQIGAIQQIPSLCAGEQIYSTFQDLGVPAGFYLYVVKWNSNPDNGGGSGNHDATRLVSFR